MQMTDPSSVALPRQLLIAAATGVAQRCQLLLWGSVTCGVTWWRNDPTDMGSIINIVYIDIVGVHVCIE